MLKSVSLSVIVPVKNMEKFLKKCLDSILIENEVNIEIIIVDFGSKDSTMEIAHNYKNFDHRVIIISNENGNAASARDKGMCNANGEYISFIDADDWIDNGTLAILYHQAVLTNVDIISARYKTILEKDSSILGESGFLEITEQINSENIDTFLCGIARGDLNLEVWNKLYRRQFLLDNKIHFNSQNGVNGEDTLFNLQCILSCPSLTTTSLLYYNHLIRENSLANSEGKNLSIRFMTIIKILKNDMFFKKIHCENGISQIMISLQIQDLVDSLKDPNGIKAAILIYENFEFYKKYLSIAISSNYSTRNRKVLCILMKMHAYKLISFICKRGS